MMEDYEYQTGSFYQYLVQGFDSCALRALQGAPAGGPTGVAGAHKFTEGVYFLVPFRRVSRLRRPFLLRPDASRVAVPG